GAWGVVAVREDVKKSSVRAERRSRRTERERWNRDKDIKRSCRKSQILLCPRDKKQIPSLIGFLSTT
ncbi:hypothetical protein KUCAC02_031478, partial [Chaenocephalus aceratus]